MRQALIKYVPRNYYLAFKHWKYKITNRTKFKEHQKRRVTVTSDGYSYRGFDEKKAIFIHIPKCAGVSVNRSIFGDLGGGHNTIEEYISIFEPKFLTRYFKFTIVRNPWDRVVSAYFFLKKGGFSAKDSEWFNEELKNYSSFEEFVINWVNEHNIWKWHHFRPQHHYLLDSGRKLNIDFIGYFENIEEDFKLITTELNLDLSLPSTNKSHHRCYMDYYNEETKEIVRKAYANDIKLLGYTFDNTSLHEQLSNRKLNDI